MFLVMRLLPCVSALTAPAAATGALPHRCRVWIEDTDCYGIVYHVNYLRYVERAAHALLGSGACASAFTERGLLLTLQRFEGARYTAAAVLGDDLDVLLTPLAVDTAGGALCASAAIVRARDGAAIWSCGSATLAFTHVLSGGHAQWPIPAPEALARAADGADAGAGAVLSSAEAAPRSVPLDCTLQADECSPGGRLSLHAALRVFERQRSQAIGGPDALAAVQAAGIQVVVARIGHASISSPETSRGGARLGARLSARCSVRLKARATQVVFDQWLIGEDTGGKENGGEDVGGGGLLARAEVTCLCIDSATRRIVPAPEELQRAMAEL